MYLFDLFKFAFVHLVHCCLDGVLDPVGFDFVAPHLVH